MAQELYQYLSADHDKLNGLLEQAVSTSGAVDVDSYLEFRKGLLRHISIEEKIVLPAIAKWQGGQKSPMAERLRRDHSAIVSLLVPPPSASIIHTLHSILDVHNRFEEGEGGLYQILERAAGRERDRLLEELRTAPAVLVLPNNSRPEMLELARQAVSRAGYEFKQD